MSSHEAATASDAVSPGTSEPRQHSLSVTLRFRVPFQTRWGENLVLCGDDDRLGAWEPARGIWMQCFHAGDLLLWQVRVFPGVTGLLSCLCIPVPMGAAGATSVEAVGGSAKQQG